MTTLKPKCVTLSDLQISNIKQLARRSLQKKILHQSLNVSQRVHMKDEMRKLHLVDQQGNVRGIISLRCADCKKVHPDSPAAIEWWKLELKKRKLICPYCQSKNFTRTDSKKSQGELISEIIKKRSKHLKHHIEDELSTHNTRKFKKFGINHIRK